MCAQRLCLLFYTIQASRGQPLLLASNAIFSHQFKNVTLVVLPSCVINCPPLLDHLYWHDAISLILKQNSSHDYIILWRLHFSMRLFSTTPRKCCLYLLYPVSSLSLELIPIRLFTVHVIPLKLLLSKINLCVPRPLLCIPA